MDPLLIAVIALGALLLLSVTLWGSTRRGRRNARRLLAGAQADLSTARQTLQSVQLGEREAAWAAQRSGQRLDRLMADLGKADHEARRLEADLDDLRTQLGTADRELERLRGDHGEATTRIAVLEGDLSVLRKEAAAAAERIPGLEMRLASVVKERDRLGAAALRSQQLEDELAALGRVHRDLSAVREENAELRSGVLPADDGATAAQLRAEIEALRAELERTGGTAAGPEVDSRLVEAEAARRDLEQKVQALTAARSAERQSTGQRIASLERLHIDISERDRQIAALKTAIAEATAARDEALNKVAHTAGPDQVTARSDGTYAEWDQRLRERVAHSVAEATERLETKVAHLRTVIAEKERLLRHATPGGPADSAVIGPRPITAIRGIGPVIATILADHGVTTLQDVAELSEADIDSLSDDMPVYPGRIRADDWVGQARALLT